MFKKIIAPFLFVMCTFLILAVVCTGQNKIREVTNMKPYPNSPVAIVSKELKTKSFVDNKLEASRDWLKDLTIGIQNISQKNITSMSIELVVPKQANMTAELAVPLLYHPGTEDDPKNPGKQKKRVLVPGEVVRLTVEDHYYVLAMNTLRSSGVEDFGDIKIDVRRVNFEDGSRWALGFDTAPSNVTRKPLSVENSQSRTSVSFL